MKKSVLFLSMCVLSLNAFAADLVLTGVVDEEVSIDITPAAAASDLDLSASPTNLVVASVNEKSNSATGYTVSISSANKGNLKSGSELFLYTLAYDGDPIDLTSATPVPISNTTTGLVDDDKSVTISYTGKPAVEMVSGTYTDTITFTIAAD